ncbi:RING-type E3 ubiquitin transferase [Malassezia psittaci]|uniref:RING-type E3 ubiquitin transferase n=1 Tax=Malassezia psittaci TaxID=1821823 RepID=A0AAF0JK94_9BASI|nr:RING-type E3 ubiquitin transferase [Malassezia psittaci]
MTRDTDSGEDAIPMRSSNSQSSNTSVHGETLITICSPSISSPFTQERDLTHRWSVQVDAPESLVSSVADLHDVQESSSIPNLAQLGGNERATPPCDTSSLPHSPRPDSDANTLSWSLPDLFRSLTNRVRESFASPSSQDEAAQPQPINDQSQNSVAAQADTSHDTSDTETQREVSHASTQAGSSDAHGLSIRLLDAAADRLESESRSDTQSPAASDNPARDAENAPESGESTATTATNVNMASSTPVLVEENTSMAPIPSAVEEDTQQETVLTPNPGTENGPQYLMYIPRSASPFPFGFLYDTDASLVWPILDREYTHQDTGDDPRTVHVVGFPFRVSLSFRSSEPEEHLDLERASKFVRELEHVDADLRQRMRLFGYSSLGADMLEIGQDSVSGCGVCFEPYAPEDRPSWLVGEEQHERESVVVLPCPGMHTLHAHCLLEWLAQTVPSKWVCPFCRSRICDVKPDLSLREHIRRKEREVHWRCDAPACLPRYIRETSITPNASPVALADRMTTMLPCRHEIHLDCLWTSMSIENPNEFNTLGSDSDLEPELESELERCGSSEPEESHDDDDGCIASPVHSPMAHVDTCRVPEPSSDTVGKWVTCPSCRKDAWVQLPRRRCPIRSTSISS